MYTRSVKRNILPIASLFFVALFVFFTPILSSAQNSAADTGPAVTDANHPCQTPDTTPCVPAPEQNSSGFDLNVKLENPLHETTTIPQALALIMRAVFKIAIPVIVFFFLWTGLSYILALGKPEKLKDVHKMFLWTVIGTLLVLGAYTITNILIGTINTIVN